MKKKIILFAFLLALCSDAHALTYHVTTTGSDSDTGLSLDHAWLTPGKGTGILVAGDKMIVHSALGGAIYPGFKIDATAGANSGTAANRITYETTGDVFIHRNTSSGAEAVIIPAGTVWTDLGLNTAGNAHKWASPNGSVTGGNGIGGLLINHDFFAARTLFPTNYYGHGPDPWYYYDSSNTRILFNWPTDPTLDEFVVLDNGSTGIQLCGGANYYTFKGFTTEYSYDGTVVGNGNVSGNQADHTKWINHTSRYNGRRGFILEGEPNAHTADHLCQGCHFYANAEHGWKNTNDNSATADGSLTDIVIRDSLSENNGYHGYQISNGTDGTDIINSVGRNNGRNPCGRNAGGGEGCASFIGQFSNGVANNVHWINFEAYDDGTKTMYGTDNVGLGTHRAGLVCFSTTGMRADRMKLHDNRGPGIYALASTGTDDQIKNMVSYDNLTWDLEIRIFNGLSVLNSTMDGGLSGGVLIDATSTGIILKNNAISSPTGVPLITVETGATYTSDYNAWYSPDSTPFSWHGSSYNFTNYKSNSLQDANSINVDFRGEFLDYTNHLYSIDSSATNLKDAGTDLSASGVTFDYRLVPKPQGDGYSIGAYEEGSGLIIN